MTSRLLDQGMEPTSTPVSPAYDSLKRRLHGKLLDALNLGALKDIPRATLKAQLRNTLDGLLRIEREPLTEAQQTRILDEILDEVLGYGPLESLLNDPHISDILINGPHKVYVERFGKLERVDVRFRDESHLQHIINRIVNSVGRRIDESNPMIDARLSRDGSRFNAVIAPIALDGALVSIRRFSVDPIRRDDLVRLGSAPGPILDLLEGMVRAKSNILVSGGTGSGKTTFLNVLSSFIPEGERIVTIEDTAELQLQQEHVARMETRPPNLEGHGEILPRALVRNALRMRPDRILVGEIRGDESIDMLQAMNTGHEGSISTIHANSPRHALSRLQTMVGLGIGNIQGAAIREMIADALHVVVQLSRHADGRRRLTSITEVTGLESGVISTQEIFRYRQQTVSTTGEVKGVFEATGVRPKLLDRLKTHGVDFDPSTLQLRQEG